MPHEALNIAESLGIDKEWIETAREILNPSNSKGLDRGSNLTPLGVKKCISDN